jgi:dTDP-4-dehydrorhamnose 3,5-epimerase
MEIVELAIPAVKLIRPKVFRDQRGFFAETYSRRVLASHGIAEEFVQDNHSLSREKGVVRGLHFQTPPAAQGKLVRVLKGKILDVAVDLRRASPTYGRHVAVEITAESFTQIYVPIGFAHGFCTLEADTEVAYKVTDYYAPANDRGLAWDDPALGIAWPIEAAAAILSDKDRKHPRLAGLGEVFA